MAARYPHPLIAREGWPFLAPTVAAALLVVALWGWAWSIPVWLLALFILQFFRDPAREVPADPKAVLSPADGRIVAVEKVRDPYLNRDALKISVFMNVFNVHSNRSPVDGTVKQRWYHAGSCVQIAGLIARRILCYVGEGAELERGQRYGFIRFGSRVDVYLPPDAEPRAALGDTVYATETILASLKNDG
jgi:phosphatidylserine decarboxylase